MKSKPEGEKGEPTIRAINSAYYIMQMWQTGNVGSHNIKKAEDQPKEGFKDFEQAENHLIKMIPDYIKYHFAKWTILKVYSI